MGDHEDRDPGRSLQAAKAIQWPTHRTRIVLINPCDVAREGIDDHKAIMLLSNAGNEGIDVPSICQLKRFVAELHSPRILSIAI
jgi:hypothetical protein